MLLEIRGWTREQYETWLRDTLERSHRIAFRAHVR
jgi:hypothetical protein